MKYKAGKLQRRETREAIVMLAPFFLFFACFVLYPILRSILDSFTNYDLIKKEFVGLDNYFRLFRDKTFLRSIQNTLVYAVCSIVPLMALGLMAAVLVNRQTKAMFAARAVLMYPYVTSMVAVSMVWMYMYDPNNGIFNKILQTVGLDVQKFLYDPKQALWCLIIMNIWKYLGYVMIIYLAALQGVSKDLYEAASIDGAGSWRQLWSITLPGIRPISYFLMTTLCVECFKTFDQVRLMTNGGPVNATTTITYQIYMRAFSEFKMGYASAMSVVLLLIILVITLINLKVGHQLDDEGGRN